MVFLKTKILILGQKQTKDNFIKSIEVKFLLIQKNQFIMACLISIQSKRTEFGHHHISLTKSPKIGNLTARLIGRS